MNEKRIIDIEQYPDVSLKAAREQLEAEKTMKEHGDQAKDKIPATVSELYGRFYEMRILRQW